jgi:ferritin
MLEDQIQGRLNRQMSEEIYSSHLVLSLAAYLETNDLRGMAAWMRSQSNQERDHMHKFYEFIVKRGGRVLTNGSWETITEEGYHELRV